MDSLANVWYITSTKPKYKKCPVCRTECELSEKICDCCGYEFPTTGGPSFIPCSSCGALNPRGATECHACGKSLGVSFNITLNDALRTGAIIRGMDIEETDVQEGERIAKPIREKVLRSGDDILIRIIGCRLQRRCLILSRTRLFDSTIFGQYSIKISRQ